MKSNLSISFMLKLLVGDGASLYEENQNGDTACDFAIKGGFNAIASFLESRMVFSVSSDLRDLKIQSQVSHSFLRYYNPKL